MSQGGDAAKMARVEPRPCSVRTARLDHNSRSNLHNPIMLPYRLGRCEGKEIQGAKV